MFKKSFIVLTILLINIVICIDECKESNTWVSFPNMPKPTGEVGSVVLINNTLYVAGEANEETFAFNFDNNEWRTVAQRLHPGNHQSSQVINNEWYLIGGIDENSYGKVQVYNPKTNSWIEKATMPYDGGSVQTVYYEKNNSIIACGGIIGFNNGNSPGGTETTNKCSRYDINQNKWYLDIPNLPKGINHGATALKPDSDEMWLIGGRGGKNTPSDGYNIVQILNLQTLKWKTSDNSNIAPLPVGRGGTGVAVYNNNKFYVFGGETRDNPGGYATKNLVYNRTDIYDVNSNKWTQGKPMTLPRHGIYPVLKDNAIYIAAGGIHNGWSYNATFDAYCI